MSRLNPTRDARTRYDVKNGAVRSFFGSELVAPTPQAAGRSLLRKGVPHGAFLEANRDLFNLDRVSLGKAQRQVGSDSGANRYPQEHEGVPVYGSQIVVGFRKRDGAITSAVNSLDYELPPDLKANNITLDAAGAVGAARRALAANAKQVKTGLATLYVYRHRLEEEPELPEAQLEVRRCFAKMGRGRVDQAYFVWSVLVDTEEPKGHWDVFVDATNGELVAVKDRRCYVKGFVFNPDPVRSKQDDTISWSTASAVLDSQRIEVTLENLDPPVGGQYKLDGTWVKTKEIESPDYAPPTSAADFKFGAKDRGFLNVMAYYYLDQLVNYLRSLGNGTYNTAVANPIQVDPQGFEGQDNSHFFTDLEGNPCIALGEGGVPDASDPGVIVHEYGHALHWYLLGSHSNGSYEEGLNDFLAACWLDRYNQHQFQREEVMPWDQHFSGNTHWGPTRRVNLTERFDDPSFGSYGMYFKGDIHATALWDIYLNIGGSSSEAAVRNHAADELIATYLDVLVTVHANGPIEDLANGLIAADENRTGGLYRKVIWDAYRRRGLWSQFTPGGNVDVYITDSETDAGSHSSPEIHWASPDIWVRNAPPPSDPADPSDPHHGENPDDGHQPPINDVPNYLYIRIRNRGSQAAPAGTFQVEAFHMNPGTAMLWPTHFESMGSLAVLDPIPAGGSTRVGPFIWTPEIIDHECLFAIVHGPTDTSIAPDLHGEVDHWKLVRYDNNVGQRNVSPHATTPGGKVKTSFVVRGSNHASINSLRIDAAPLPSDTQLKIKLARSITNQAQELRNLRLVSQNSKWSTLEMKGETLALVREFPLAANEERVVTLEVDFSFAAEHLQRYPITISQDQNGATAGTITIEIQALKEQEDYLYGNTSTRELHLFGCQYRRKMSVHNQVPFLSVKDALARGYNGCAFCMPEHNTD